MKKLFAFGKKPELSHCLYIVSSYDDFWQLLSFRPNRVGTQSLWVVDINNFCVPHIWLLC